MGEVKSDIEVDANFTTFGKKFQNSLQARYSNLLIPVSHFPFLTLNAFVWTFAKAYCKSRLLTDTAQAYSFFSGSENTFWIARDIYRYVVRGGLAPIGHTLLETGH